LIDCDQAIGHNNASTSKPKLIFHQGLCKIIVAFSA